MMAKVLISTVAMLALVAVVCALTDARMEKENAFAKDCNDRGGVAQVIDGMRQCIGARSAP